MDKNKLSCCVESCKFNEKGCRCTKDSIKITNCKKEKTAHYCDDYQEE